MDEFYRILLKKALYKLDLILKAIFNSKTIFRGLLKIYPNYRKDKLPYVIVTKNNFLIGAIQYQEISDIYVGEFDSKDGFISVISENPEVIVERVLKL